jgi:hypothetical protein
MAWDASEDNAGVLSGRLEEFRLVELLQALGMGMNTGALHLRRHDGLTGLVYFDNGALVSASELDTEALTLGHVIQQLNLADEAQIEQAFQLQVQDPLGKRIGERLVDLGILLEDQLATALRSQILWTIRELAFWRGGTYQFHPNQQFAFTMAARIDTQAALMEILRYEHEWEGLAPYFSEGMRTHLAMVFDPPARHPLRFQPPAWRLIARVNTHHTVRRIATALHQLEIETARMIAPLVHEGLLVPVGVAGRPGLPEEAQRLSMQHFDLFSLLIEMEQDWIKRKTPLDHLVALAGYINRTMRSLEDACQASGLNLAPDTLASLLERENVRAIGDYAFQIQHNRLDVDDFTVFCRKRLDSFGRANNEARQRFYDEASGILQRALAVAFQAINARIASPIEREQNQEAWEALFLSFRGQPSTSG